MFAAEIRRKRVGKMRSSRWRWHLDEVFVKVNGVQHYPWRAVDHEGEVLEAYVSKHRDKKAALKFLRKLMKRHDNPLFTSREHAEEAFSSAKVRGDLVRSVSGYAEVDGIGPGFPRLSKPLHSAELAASLAGVMRGKGK